MDETITRWFYSGVYFNRLHGDVIHVTYSCDGTMMVSMVPVPEWQCPCDGLHGDGVHMTVSIVTISMWRCPWWCPTIDPMNCAGSGSGMTSVEDHPMTAASSACTRLLVSDICSPSDCDTVHSGLPYHTNSTTSRIGLSQHNCHLDYCRYLYPLLWTCYRSRRASI